ncbi:MAG: DUF6519 domain-containing protein [Gemmatimonadaceae bacterium]
MKGDISRETFDATKHYSGVRMQQGRVQTDADWNEQEALQRRRIQVEARDVIGRCGAPEDNAGFAISIAANALKIGAGRFYADGILCENETDGLAYEAQADLPSPVPWLDQLAKLKSTAAMVYLDVWERHITPLDDPLLREVALGGPDTATRVKTVWQVRVLPLATAASDPAQVKDLQAKRADGQKKLDALKAAGGSPGDISKLQSELDLIDAKIATLSGIAPTCGGSFKEWDDLSADPDRRLNARTQPPAPASGPCVVPPTSGFRRLENQLYRVEVHTPGAPGTATFKWSRDNGSVVTAIEKMSGKDITVHDLGPDDVLGFASGQWVEIIDDRSELNGVPGQLAQIDAVSSSLRRITLKAAPTPLSANADGVDRLLHPKLRRWDQGGATATANGVATTAAFLPLEDGVEVQFSGGAFRTGDFWVIPARTATGEIEWPPFAIPNTAPAPQLPRGIAHHFCRLAILALGADGKTWTVSDDCRKLFPPLNRPCCTNDALHVVSTNWSNDDLLAAATFTRDGLRIRLDAAPDPLSLTTDTVQVAIESLFQGSIGFARVYIEGTVTRDPNDDHVIVWMPPGSNTTGLSTGGTTTTGTTTGTTTTGGLTTLGTGLNIGTGLLAGGLVTNTLNPNQRKVSASVVAKKTSAKKTASTAKNASSTARKLEPETSSNARIAASGEIRLRVTLKGHLIWSDPKTSVKRVFLDGQAFGQPDLRADGKTSRIAYAFPSGSHVRASDFESWFFVGGKAQPTPLQVTLVRFLNPNFANSSAGDIKPPVPATQNVVFKAAEQIRVVEITFNRNVLASSVAANSASVILEQDINAARKRLVVDLQAAANIVRITLRDPAAFSTGKFFLTCFGTSAVGAVTPTVKAEDDQTLLDGDYDSQAGGNLVLPFTAG